MVFCSWGVPKADLLTTFSMANLIFIPTSSAWIWWGGVGFLGVRKLHIHTFKGLIGDGRAL